MSIEGQITFGDQSNDQFQGFVEDIMRLSRVREANDLVDKVSQISQVDPDEINFARAYASLYFDKDRPEVIKAAVFVRRALILRGDTGVDGETLVLATSINSINRVTRAKIGESEIEELIEVMEFNRDLEILKDGNFRLAHKASFV